MVNTLSKKNTRSSVLYFGPAAAKRVAAFHLARKRRNVFFTVTDLHGSVVGACSAKIFAQNRKKRHAPHIINLLTRRLILVLKAYRVDIVQIYVKTANWGIVNSAVRTLKAGGVGFNTIRDMVPIAHNGCRKKKIKRL